VIGPPPHLFFGEQMAVIIEGYLEPLSDDKWRFGGEMLPNDVDGDHPSQSRPSPFFESGVKELAAILADCFNPIRSSEQFVPLVPRRGLPADLSAALKAWLQQYVGEDSFACTWFTAREALAFGWTERIMRRRAEVDPRATGLFADCPKGFPQANWPKNLPIQIAGQMRGGVEVEWLATYAEIVADFYGQVLPRLINVGAPERTRLVVALWWQRRSRLSNVDDRQFANCVPHFFACSSRAWDRGKRPTTWERASRHCGGCDNSGFAFDEGSLFFAALRLRRGEYAAVCSAGSSPMCTWKLVFWPRCSDTLRNPTL
jgi:hypothetical protein